MKIGIDCRMIKASGVGRYVSNLVENLAKIDTENRYALFLQKNDFENYEFPAANFSKVLADFPWNSFGEQTKFTRIIKKECPDIMHFPHFNVPLFYNDKFIVTIHDLTVDKYKTAGGGKSLAYGLKYFAYKKVIKHAAEKSLKILTLSDFTKKEIRRRLGIAKEKIIPTYAGVPNELAQTPEKPGSLEALDVKKPFILYTGNAYPHKNLERLVEALLYLEDVNCVLVGEKNEFYKQLEEKVESLDLSERVIITGFVDDGQLVSLYKNAACFAFPSLNEGFGFPALEALQFGLPVAASKASSLPEVLGDATLYFDPENVNDMARVLKKILTNNTLREELIKKGLKQVKKFSWEKMAKETLEAYKLPTI